jgi:hypothetical protein
MALWGISTTTETAANNYGIPKYLSENDRNNTPWNCFADVRGWIYRRYHGVENSGLSTGYYDEVLVPVAGLNTGGFPGAAGPDENGTGLGQATPVAVFFEDPNLASPISLGAGGTDRISLNANGYVHVVYNENVYCSAGATINILRSTGAAIIGTASSVGASYYNADISVFTNTDGTTTVRNFNGQISNRISFKFTAPASGIGTVLSIDVARGIVGTITDFSGGSTSSIKTFTSDITRQIGGAGSYLAVDRDNGLPVGIGTTTLTLVA